MYYLYFQNIQFWKWKNYNLLPIQIKSVEIMFFQIFNNMLNEVFSGFGIVDQTTIFISFTIIPASNGQKDFSILTFQLGHFFVEFIGLADICPRIVGSNLQGFGIQSGKPVNDMSAEIWFDILWFVFSLIWSVECPICEI